ncbi:MAG TPA: cupin domain-containing protein [Solirubrobacteraceae bacterium]|jgi:quercetin dioxygenase-like cupin family protein|nr:cupin domain-containing protein [Solirubrobacteraceae bacterium]
MPEPPRRIVTGHDAAGRGRIVSDGPAPASRAVADGATFHDLWVTAASPAPLAAAEPEPIRDGQPLGPPPAGTRARIVDMPPGTRSPMHRTESVDYGVVLDGEITLVLDDGSATTVRRGELVVQRGTDHAWENRSQSPARILFVLVAGRFDDRLRSQLPADPL